jgi:hypothetical protein
MRSRMRYVPRTAVLLGVLVLLALPGVSSAATIVNGGFETGSFTGWTVVNQAGGSGDWFVYTGTSTPLNGLPVAAPPEGTHAAVTDQFGPGSHVLYQDVVLESGFSHTLSLVVYYENLAGFFATPSTLDFNAFPNQQYRIDVLRATADPASTAPGDVLATVFQTREGDPASLAPTTMSFDLTPFAGMTVRIRFAEVDNQLFFNASVDNVAIESVRLLPTTKEQCRNGGWRSFGVFKNQGDCVSFVATKERNQPAGSQPQPPSTSNAGAAPIAGQQSLQGAVNRPAYHGGRPPS